MTHDVFGKLKYKDRDESWAGSAMLPRFAAVGVRPEPREMTPEEMEQMTGELNATLENLRKMMQERFGERAAAAFAEVDRAADEELRKLEEEPQEPDPVEDERQRRATQRREKNASLLAKGKYPFRVVAPEQSEPTPAQTAAFRFLVDNEQAVFDAIMEQVWESYRQRNWQIIPGMAQAENIAGLKDHFAITRLDIAREARGGFAHLSFLLDAAWDDEHGLLVVYSPDTHAAEWTTWDGLYELLESDEPEPEGEEYVPTPHDELLEAILTDNEAKARELVAAGADINALGKDEYPPLWISVDQMEAEEVRRLLAFGADPNLANEDERTTPLKHAKRLYRDMGFAPSKNRNEFMDGVLSMMREAMNQQMEEIKNRLETIIKLLEDAGGK